MRKVLLKISASAMVEAEEALASMMEQLFRQSPALYTNEETLVTEVSVYLDDPRAWTETKRLRLLRHLARMRAEGQQVRAGRVRVQRLCPHGWADSWKRHFRPLEIGGALLIKPTWSRRRARPGQAVIELDPGLTFGTGQHPTTLFCLEQLVACRTLSGVPGLLDAGTGSGILAVAAAKLGYAPVEAFDVDPLAVKAAKANARANRLSSAIRVRRADLRRLPLEPAARFHVVCANLVDDLLVAETERICRRLRPDGRLVLAGILAHQFPRVQAAYIHAGLMLVAQRTDHEWLSGTFQWSPRALSR
jgi:ribosomal protein L11 methyltransferase